MIKCKQRGFTLVEVTLAMTLSALVIGVTTMAYAHTVVKTSRAMAQTNVLLQVQTFLDEVDRTVANAISCQLVSSGGKTGLKCIMPAAGSDKDGDGVLDTYKPASVNRRQLAKYSPGKRVWFYQSDATGAFAASGAITWKAVRSDDVLPTAGDALSKWAYYSGTSRAKFNLVDQVGFALGADSQSIVTTVRASSQVRSERIMTTAMASASDYAISLSRTVSWRNWRQ